MQFVGEFGCYTDATGLIYVRRRVYDPRNGRWISRDPIGFAGGDVNLYRYVGNNPVNRVDPSGLLCPPPKTCCCCANSVKLVQAIKIPPGSCPQFKFQYDTVVGHDIVFAYSMNYIEGVDVSDQGDCTMQWWEKNSETEEIAKV